MIQFIDGNDALVLGAIKAGCRFFAGYPITPATPILLQMMDELPKIGGVAIQGEDEIASIGMCIGAAMTGKKVLTASSGPGLSLYSENIGLAIMGEVPMVIVDVQRLGPATGSATKDGNLDIQFVRWCTSGGFPVIALAPSSVEDCYSLTIEAFNLAEKYRTPVFILSSKELAQTRMRVDLSTVKTPAIIERSIVNSNKPFSFNTDIYPVGLMGGEILSRFTGSSHDEAGNLAKSPKVIEDLVVHLQTKISEKHISIWEYEGDEQAETVIITYGVVSRATSAAFQSFKNKSVGLLTLKSLWPVPETVIRHKIKSAKQIVMPELNFGQYAQEIERIKSDHQKLITIQQVNSELIQKEKIETVLREVVA